MKRRRTLKHTHHIYFYYRHGRRERFIGKRQTRKGVIMAGDEMDQKKKVVGNSAVMQDAT
jgi:hypothetical protein